MRHEAPCGMTLDHIEFESGRLSSGGAYNHAASSKIASKFKEHLAVEDGEAMESGSHLNIALAAPLEKPAPAPQSPSACSMMKDLPWYAVYTWARHEKKVSQHFEERGIHHFLPLYSQMNKWNKRTVLVTLPLFQGYVFVQTPWEARFQALNVPGVVHYVGTAKAPTQIPVEEIEAVRIALNGAAKVTPHPYLAAGNRVRVASGPMTGLTGVIQRSSSGCRIVVSMDMIMRSVAVELDASSLIAA